MSSGFTLSQNGAEDWLDTGPVGQVCGTYHQQRQDLALTFAGGNTLLKGVLIAGVSISMCFGTRTAS